MFNGENSKLEEQFTSKLASELEKKTQNSVFQPKVSGISPYIRNKNNYPNVMSSVHVALDISTASTDDKRKIGSSLGPANENSSKQVSQINYQLEENKEFSLFDTENPESGINNHFSNSNPPGNSLLKAQIFSKSTDISLNPNMKNSKGYEPPIIEKILQPESIKNLNPASKLPNKAPIIVKFINVKTGEENQFKIYPKESKKESVSNKEMVLTYVNNLVFIQSQSADVYFSSNKFSISANEKLMAGKTLITFILKNENKLKISFINSRENISKVGIKYDFFFRLNEEGKFVVENKPEKATGKIFREGKGWKIISYSNTQCLWKPLFNPDKEYQYPLPILLNESQLFSFYSENDSEQFRIKLIK